MEQVRTFIAVELPAEVKDGLAALEGRLKRGHEASVKWVQPAGIHVTLKFLGNVNADIIPQLREAVGRAAEGIGPFRLGIDGLGVFPNPRQTRVIWAGVEGEIDRLGILQRRIDEALKPLGFAPEGRAFVPHLTLGRVREETGEEERDALGKLVATVTNESTIEFVVAGISIMRSQLRPQGALHTRLEWIQL